MERRRLADILANHPPLFNQLFGDEPSPLHSSFQAAFGVLQRFQADSNAYSRNVKGSLKPPFSRFGFAETCKLVLASPKPINSFWLRRNL